VKYDFVFFTGSKNVGKIIAEKCASTLTPYIPELGGKCPCIVDDSSNLEKATRRIARGKLFNAGQTCVAPDYVLVHENVYEPFIQLLKTKIEKFSRDSIDSSSFPKIINLTHFHRLFSYIKNDNLVFGGKVDEHNLLIHPTIINENPDEEIFGPILPVLKYKDINEAISLIKKHDKPLALYIFSKNKKNIASLISNIDSGGVCVNEVLMQIANHHLPFGGVGLSGVGSYHGKYSYAAFSHPRSELVGSNHLDSSLFYPP
jgi:aldehyde dehydrogenase (NAD+)